MFVGQEVFGPAVGVGRGAVFLVVVVEGHLEGAIFTKVQNEEVRISAAIRPVLTQPFQHRLLFLRRTFLPLAARGIVSVGKSHVRTE